MCIATPSQKYWPGPEMAVLGECAINGRLCLFFTQQCFQCKATTTLVVPNTKCEQSLRYQIYEPDQISSNHNYNSIMLFTSL